MPRSQERLRQCQNCQKEYVLGEYSTLHKYCSPACRAAWHYNRWKSSGGKRDKTKTRSYWLKHKYGISEQDYLNMLEQQGNRCAICETEQPMGYGWHIDHCHTQGNVRGILCQCCNQALGLFKENTQTIKKAIQYLENFSNEG